MKQYDAIVIGSGQAGNPLAKKLADAGWKTALIEKRFIGGTCINDGCTPTKTMIASARVAFLARKSAELGINIPDISIDLPTIVRRKEHLVSSARNGTESRLERMENLELIFGTARFTGNKVIEIKHKTDGKTEEITAGKIFINTGALPAVPAIDGLNSIPHLNSTTILDLNEVPRHLLIVGGGYIALELGQMFKRFGSEVTIIEHSADLLKNEDRDIAKCLEDILKGEGLVFYKGAAVRKLHCNQKEIEATVEIGGTLQYITCSHVLLAAGRTPQTKELHLYKTGVETNDKGYIKVNDQLQTTQPGIYALGDVKGGPAFTHISYNDYVVLAKNLLNNENASIKDRPVPYCMFTDPQLGRVGITENEAKKQGINYKVATLDMSHVARASETGDTRGMMKAVVDADTRQILGVAVIGTEGGEIMSVLQMAMIGNITYDVIRENIFAHPLFSESLNNLFLKLDP